MAAPFIKTFLYTVIATVVVGTLLVSLSQFVGVLANTTPVLSSVSASYVTNNSVIINFTSNEEGTYYYLVYHAADSAPTIPVVKAQGSAVAKGTGEVLAAANFTEATGLSSESEYTAYLFVENSDPSPSLLHQIDFTTVDQTTGAVVRAEAHPNQANVDAAQVLVSAMVDGSLKTQFQNRLDAVQADVTAVVAVENLISALPSASNLTLADENNIIAARSAYDALSTYRKSLVSNFEALYFLEAFIEVLTNADDAITFAENNPDQTNVNAAQILVTEIPDGTIKTSFQARIDAVQATVDAENAATVGVTIDLIDALPSLSELTLPHEDQVAAARTSYFNLSSYRQTLVTNYQKLLDSEALILILNTIDDAVSLAESTQNQTDIDAAQVAVNDLADGNMKTHFQNRLDALVTDINTTKSITSFVLSTPATVGGIFESSGLIKLVVPNGTNRAALTPTIVNTGASISPASGVTQNFTSPVQYQVTALDSSTKNYSVTVSELTATQIAPDSNGSVSIGGSTSEAVVVSPTLALNISVANGTSNPIVNFSALLTDGIGTLPSTQITTPVALMTIASSTVITSDDPNWDGTFTPPVSASVSLPSVSGQSQTLGVGLTVGDAETTLSFNKGVRLVFLGQANKKVGYREPNASFIEITSVCGSDSQSAGDALPVGGDCKISIGNDLVVWTKHLTTFATYSSTSTSSTGGSSSSGGSSGGGGSVTTPVCTDSKPSSTPDLFQVNVDGSTARVFFAPVFGLDRYFVSFSTNPSAEEHGVGVILGGVGVQNYLVQYLKPNTTYYFKVRAQNGCMPGEWSNTLRVVTRSSGESRLVAFYRNSLLGNLIAAIRTFTFTALTTAPATTEVLVSPSPAALIDEASDSAEASPSTKLGEILVATPQPVRTISVVSPAPRVSPSPTPSPSVKPSVSPSLVVSPTPVSTSTLAPLPSPILVATPQVQPTVRLNFWQRVLRFFFAR